MSGKLTSRRWFVGHHFPQKVFRKVNNKNYNSPFFDNNDWQHWKVFVRNFYKNCSLNSVNQISPIFVEIVSDNRPYICVKMFDHNIIALLDSGATVSIISKTGIDLIQKFNLKIHPSDLKHVTTADGNEQLVTGIVDLPISINNNFRIVKCVVVPSLTHSFIFGSDFCKSFGIKIDFKNNTWDIQSNLENTIIDVVTNINSVEHIHKVNSLAKLSLEQKCQADNIIDSFKEISSDSGLGRTNKIMLSIDTGDAKPFKQRQYLMSPYMLNILNNELDEMLRLGVIEESHSPWNSPVLLVKKSTGEYRFCFDGRRLNELTKHDSYPLPRIDRILNMLRDAKYISSIDLRKAFWQIPLHESSKEKTAFSVPGRGLFHFNVMPFGLCNSAQTQQRLVDALFGPKFEPKIFAYLDDIIITSSTFEEHNLLLKEVKKSFKRCKSYRQY